MDLKNRSVALYGRFASGTREQFRREIIRRGGSVARDLTRRSDVLVVGALAMPLVDSGSLEQRLQAAAERNIQIFGERSFQNALLDRTSENPTLPLATALAPTALTAMDAEILAAFDLIVLKGEKCRFVDASALRTAAELMSHGRSRAEVVRILSRARDMAPSGRYKITLTPTGEAALLWESGLTTLEGQGFLPLDFKENGVDELFEQAELLEVSGDREEAARLYEQCARADKSDPIALFNLANIRLAQGRHGEAERSYRQALARDPNFAEARYNLALVLEALGKLGPAAEELARVLALEPFNADALFNRAQMLMKMGEIGEAKDHYERYLALDPPADWALKARKAIAFCVASLAAAKR